MKRNRSLGHVAVGIASILLATTAGCAAPTDSTESESGTNAVTVDQVKPAKAEELLSGVPVKAAKTLGAKSWSLFRVEASGKTLSKESKGVVRDDFDGWVAFATDADDQVVWVLVADASKPKELGVTRLDVAGKSLAVQMTPELRNVLELELQDLLLGSAKKLAAKMDADATKAFTELLGVGGVALTAITFAAAGATAGIGLGLCVLAVIAYRSVTD